jgi:hypothetical protein
MASLGSYLQRHAFLSSIVLRSISGRREKYYRHIKLQENIASQTEDTRTRTAQSLQWLRYRMKTGVRFHAGQHFSRRHSFQTRSVAHVTPFIAGARVLCSGLKRPGNEANHSPLSDAEVMNAWSYTFTPTYVEMAWCFN